MNDIEVQHHGYRLIEFEETYSIKPETISLKQRIYTFTHKCCSIDSVKNTLTRLFPIVQTLKSYKIAEDLPNDLIAGLTVGILIVPQGMAFGALSTLPPVVGLYISLFAPLTYFFFGTSRQSSLGCIAVLSLMMADILDKYDENVKNLIVNSQNNSRKITTEASFQMSSTINEYVSAISTTHSEEISEDNVAKRIEVAGAITLVAGLVTMVLGKCHFGFVVTYMSNSLITSFTVAVAVHVLTSQLKNVFGLCLSRHSGTGKVILIWYDVFANISKTNPVSVITCAVCIIVIYLVKSQINEKFKSKMKIPVPIEFIVMITGTLISHFGHFQTNYNVPVVGNIPVGIPVLHVPNPLLAKDYIMQGFVIIMVAYAQSVSTAKTFGLKHNYKIDSDQEMFAIGSACLVCSLFSGFFTAASVSRSIVQDGAGGRTQVTSLVACLLVMLVIMAIGKYVYDLPLCILASIIIVSLRPMFMKLFTLKTLWYKSQYDCTVWIVTFVTCVVLDTYIGLLIGILVSLIFVVVRTQILSTVIVGVVNQTSEFRSLTSYKQVAEIPGIKVIRLDAPLYFPNSEMFVKKVYKLTGINPIKLKKYLHKSKNQIAPDQVSCTDENKDLENVSPPHHVILDLSGVTFFDLMGVSALDQVVTEFEDLHINVLIAETRETVIGILRSNDFINKHGHVMYTTLEAAISAATIVNNTSQTSLTDSNRTQLTSLVPM